MDSLPRHFAAFMNYEKKGRDCVWLGGGFRGAGCVSIYETTGNKPYSAGKGVSYVAGWRALQVLVVSGVSLLSSRGLTIISNHRTAAVAAWGRGGNLGEGFALAAVWVLVVQSVTVQLSHSSM